MSDGWFQATKLSVPVKLHVGVWITGNAATPRDVATLQAVVDDEFLPDICSVGLDLLS